MAEIHQNPRGAARADEHPSGDNRFKMLDATMKRQLFQADALIEVLHTAQELFGYLRDDILLYVAHGLKLPPAASMASRRSITSSRSRPRVPTPAWSAWARPAT